ncbi:hypothetical protein NDU88_004934 [Pleurodeles waltl]|uniref:BLOC-1-related complex subunit 7 n=1 Tax=Pleurodeles waltl TaxID=8319 RepID=A0AAV7V4E1_PLEWA|nr:hypothetical protein NDU88_004934 [Pleurodeles waltl]
MSWREAAEATQGAARALTRGPGLETRVVEELMLGERKGSRDYSLAITLVEHTQKCKDILNAVLDIKTTLEPKIDALRIDIGHLREDHKK